MIVSITPNPSVDISYFIDGFEVGKVHRLTNFNKVPGGKGINVAKVLNQLKTKVICTGFLGGSGGEFIKSGLEKLDLEHDFVDIEGETRSSLAISDLENHTSTEVREPGPMIDMKAKEEFFRLIESHKERASIFSSSGSLPKGLDESFYDELLQRLEGKTVVIDTSGDVLRHIVFESPIKPRAIKPNIDEIRDIFGKKVDQLSYLEILKLEELKEIEIVIISLGKDGSVAKFNDRYFECSVPEIKAVNPVGSGDASLAGLCFGLESSFDPIECLKYSMACGVLNALEEKIGYINTNNLKKIKDKIIVKELK